ncbi:MAG: DUF4295 domain-containing protein [Bacteroidales bacterium]|nr:DUF4295 domain-containing protein [Bacteroidales bacterium]
MAKKAVATFGGDRVGQKSVVKCIRMVKSDRTGSYVFDEELVPTEKVKDFFAQK